MLGSFSRASRSFSSNQCSRAVEADAVMKSVTALLSYSPRNLKAQLKRNLKCAELNSPLLKNAGREQFHSCAGISLFADRNIETTCFELSPLNCAGIFQVFPNCFLGNPRQCWLTPYGSANNERTVCFWLGSWEGSLEPPVFMRRRAATRCGEPWGAGGKDCAVGRDDTTNSPPA